MNSKFGMTCGSEAAKSILDLEFEVFHLRASAWPAEVNWNIAKNARLETVIFTREDEARIAAQA
jgi:hypothetical protein